jgi:hypothetical protein
MRELGVILVAIFHWKHGIVDVRNTSHTPRFVLHVMLLVSSTDHHHHHFTIILLPSGAKWESHPLCVPLKKYGFLAKRAEPTVIRNND